MRSWAEINLDNLRHNINILKTIAGDSMLLPAIKADAYGHGIAEVFNVLISEGIKWVGVATFNEAEKLRKLDKATNILVFGPVETEDMRKAIDMNIAFPLTSMDEIDFLNENNLAPRVHLAVDTGMGRIGFSRNSLDEVKRKTEENSKINVEGIFSHLSSADTSPEYTKRQLEDFKKIVEKFPKIKYRHILNSFGSMQFSESKYDIIRPGIILYGGIKKENAFSYDFKPVMALKSRVSFIKKLENNSFISYNRKYEARAGEKIATVSIGYADGIRRDLTGKGEVVINNRRCRIAGTICMDQLMVSIPEDLEVNVGDTVEFFGENIHIEEVAEKCGTISYEILCGIGQRVTRIYVGEK